LPHLGFVESEQRPGAAVVAPSAPTASAQNSGTIPAGNTTVGNVTPINRGIGQGTGNGNSDIGAFGL